MSKNDLNLNNSSSEDFQKWAVDFKNRYNDVLDHWQKHSDPIKKGMATVVLELAEGNV